MSALAYDMKAPPRALAAGVTQSRYFFPYSRVGLTRASFQRRMEAMMGAPMYKEVAVYRTMEAAWVLEDLNVQYKEVTVLRYSSTDYQMPLLSSNARYRCGLHRGQGEGRL
jgi:hypothetical protein